MVMSWVITLYTLWQMLEMYEMIPGKRLDRYHELGQVSFEIPQHHLSGLQEHQATYFIMMFGSVQFVFLFLPNFNSISGISLAAAVMSLVCSIAWMASLAKGASENVSYGLRGKNMSENTFNFFNALGDIAFAFAGHNVVLEIQATIPSTPEKPSKKPMWKGVVVAYFVVFICYFPVAFFGYYVFGDKVDDNILMTLEKPAWLIASANIFVFIHVVGGYQVHHPSHFTLSSLSGYMPCHAMLVFDMMETFLVKQMKFKPSDVLRFTTRTLYVGLTMFIGMTIPFFGGLLRFFGGFALIPTTYFISGRMHNFSSLVVLQTLNLYFPDRRAEAAPLSFLVRGATAALLMAPSPLTPLSRRINRLRISPVARLAESPSTAACRGCPKEPLRHFSSSIANPSFDLHFGDD
ncbi:hypothetical protein SASPL_130946 [Salvia splendens]|uniref:Amino acid transporter transmembrane domain-containing protein n=1 Tax=Salvia splendens TaxID=180675 RepID=A0A8X8X959_SALSN|nr:hypothetical protein SASPL_130946 [Salvia splendens]